MSVSIFKISVGDPELRDSIHGAVERAFSGAVGRWEVSLIAANSSDPPDLWVLTVAKPDGGQIVRDLFGTEQKSASFIEHFLRECQHTFGE
jgi:hypothetical protein